MKFKINFSRLSQLSLQFRFYWHLLNCLNAFRSFNGISQRGESLKVKWVVKFLLAIARFANNWVMQNANYFHWVYVWNGKTMMWLYCLLIYIVTHHNKRLLQCPVCSLPRLFKSSVLRNFHRRHNFHFRATFDPFWQWNIKLIFSPWLDNFWNWWYKYSPI